MSLEVDVGLSLGGLLLDVQFTLEEGGVVVLLGPNGAGKTTLLRAIAGLIPIERGRVALDGDVLEDTAAGRYVPTEGRSMGFVFQDYLLFPHLSVLDNVAFGLRARGDGRAASERVAREWLARMDLERYAASRPSALSGGERQRVALARALAPGPRVLLLDEPLAALDATTRATVRRDLKRHLASFRGVRLMVTHDPLEAVTLADRLIVIEQGKQVQSGTPVEVTERPRSRYVADLVGVNLLRGEADQGMVRIVGGAVVAAAGAGSGSGSGSGEVFADGGRGYARRAGRPGPGRRSASVAVIQSHRRGGLPRLAWQFSGKFVRWFGLRPRFSGKFGRWVGPRRRFSGKFEHCLDLGDHPAWVGHHVRGRESQKLDAYAEHAVRYVFPENSGGQGGWRYVFPENSGQGRVEWRRSTRGPIDVSTS